MKRNHNFLERVAQFVSGKGFYLVLLLCVAAIGVSGYFLMRSILGTGEEPAEAVAGNTQMPQITASAAPSAGPSATPTGSPPPRAAPSAAPSVQPSQQPQETAAPEISQKPAALVFTWPVNGAIIASFSVETLLYDETMLDWRTHEGIDLAAEEGTRVLAVAAGTVSQVYEDDLMGVTVVIDHGDGLESVYSNLAQAPDVAEGDSVYTGDIIGVVGNTAPAESGRAAHLHFAMYRDGEPVDPEEYLPDY